MKAVLVLLLLGMATAVTPSPTPALPSCSAAIMGNVAGCVSSTTDCDKSKCQVCPKNSGAIWTEECVAKTDADCMSANLVVKKSCDTAPAKMCVQIFPKFSCLALPDEVKCKAAPSASKCSWCPTIGCRQAYQNACEMQGTAFGANGCPNNGNTYSGVQAAGLSVSTAVVAVVTGVAQWL